MRFMRARGLSDLKELCLLNALPYPQYLVQVAITALVFQAVVLCIHKRA